MINPLDKLNQKEACELLDRLNLFLDCIFRADGRIEWIDETGCGHTIWSPKEQGRAGYVHGCNGRCKSFFLELNKRIEDEAIKQMIDETPDSTVKLSYPCKFCGKPIYLNQDTANKDGVVYHLLCYIKSLK